MTGKPKVLVDGHVFDGPFQGTRTFLKGLYGAMASSDAIDVYMAAHDVANLEKEFGEHTPIRFVQLESNSSWRRLGLEFPKLVRRYGFDYIHYQYMDAPVKNCRTIITTHDVLFLDYPEDFPFLYRQKKHLFALAARRADILTTVSTYSKGKIHQHFGIQENKIHVLKEGVECAFYENVDVDTSRNRILTSHGFDRFLLYVGRIEPRKNHHSLLQAYIGLCLWKKGIRLVLIGAESIPNLHFNSLMENLPDHVRRFICHFSAMPFSEMKDFIAACEVFIYPSFAEGFGLPPLEAAAMKVETLLSNTSSMKEFGFFGDRFFDPENVDELQTKISSILSKEGRFLNMSQLSDEVKRVYNWGDCASHLENLILENFQC